MKRFALQVQAFSDVVEAAELSLRNYCTENKESSLVDFICSRRILDNIGHEAEAVEEHLRAIRDQVRGLGSSSILWASMKWALKKSSILGLFPEMECVKSSLNLLVAICVLHKRTCSGRDGSEEEM